MPLIVDEGRDGVPEVGPQLKVWSWEAGGGGAQQFGKEFAALQGRRFPGSDPVSEGRTAVFGPMPEQRGFADPTATIQHDQLAGTGCVRFRT